MKNKRLIALIMAFVMVLPMISSCTNAKKSSKVVQEDDPWYDSTKFAIESDIPSGAWTDFSQICVSGDRIYYTYIYSEDLWATSKAFLDTYDLEGTKLSHVQIIYPEGYKFSRIFTISDDEESGGISAIVLLNNGGKVNPVYLTIDKETGETSDVKNLLDEKSLRLRVI